MFFEKNNFHIHLLDIGAVLINSVTQELKFLI